MTLLQIKLRILSVILPYHFKTKPKIQTSKQKPQTHFYSENSLFNLLCKDTIPTCWSGTFLFTQWELTIYWCCPWQQVWDMLHKSQKILIGPVLEQEWGTHELLCLDCCETLNSFFTCFPSPVCCTHPPQDPDQNSTPITQFHLW